MITEIIASLVIFTAILANFDVVFFAYIFSTGDWVKEVIIEAYTDFKDGFGGLCTFVPHPIFSNATDVKEVYDAEQQWKEAYNIALNKACAAYINDKYENLKTK